MFEVWLVGLCWVVLTLNQARTLTLAQGPRIYVLYSHRGGLNNLRINYLFVCSAALAFKTTYVRDFVCGFLGMPKREGDT